MYLPTRYDTMGGAVLSCPFFGQSAFAFSGAYKEGTGIGVKSGLHQARGFLIQDTLFPFTSAITSLGAEKHRSY